MRISKDVKKDVDVTFENTEMGSGLYYDLVPNYIFSIGF
jgi:hypothetical protein